MPQVNDDFALPPVMSASAPASPSRAQDRLGQQDFLTLLTTQMRNQDPLNPIQNTEFLGQMAQFSTVAGIDRLHEGLEAMSASFRDMRFGAASTLIGKSVLVPAPLAYPDAQGAFRGVAEIDAPAQDVQVSFADPRSGLVLHREVLGPHPGGAVPFGWEKAPSDLVASGQPLRVSVSALQDGITRDVPVQVYARVLSATLGRGQDDITLDVEGFGKMHSLEIETLR